MGSGWFTATKRTSRTPSTLASWPGVLAPRVVNAPISALDWLPTLAKLAGAKVRASYAEDAALLGGAVVQIGSTIYDGSVRAQLQQLKQRLVNA